LSLGETKELEYEKVAISWLEMKVKFCEDHIKVQEKLAPGESEYCAYISGHYGESLFWLNKKKFVAQKISGSEFDLKMQFSAEILQKVVRIWGNYRKRSTENIQAENARKIIKFINDKYTRLCYK